MQIQPTMLHERNDTLDIIRGFSLLGIILVNIFGFLTPQPYIQLATWFTEATDIIWHQLLDIYVQSSFYPLFAMLFGYGIAMQYLKAQERNTKFYSFVSRRIVLLFIFGMLHAYLIWWGDILATYAFCAIFLLLAIRFNGWALIILGILLNGTLHAFYMLVLFGVGSYNEPIEAFAVDIVNVQNSITAYGTGGWLDAFSQRLIDITYQMPPGMWVMSLFTVLPFMLVGAGLAKFRLIERAKEMKVLWITIAIVFTTGGLVLKNLAYLREHTFILDYVKVYIGGPTLALGYTGIIVVLCMLPVVRKVLSPIGKVGRMSLTMYIMQSIILSLLIYNYGFGLYGKLNVPLSVAIAVAVYIVQVLIAELWLWKFKQGPIETFMKKIIYWQW
ncbi:MAG: DUF418 domain-containing protein [Lysinibacillus sp.]